MKKRLLPLLLLSAVLLLPACRKKELKEPRPIISFIGVSTGSLATGVQSLSFRDTFNPMHKELVGAVQFDRISDGTPVQATWFSPDERRMPLGRTTLQIASGAKLARFSIATKDAWQAAPYLLRIDTLDRKDNAITASGSVHFFIGMTLDEIKAYEKDFLEWQKQEAEMIRKAQENAEKAKKAGSGVLE